MVPQQIAELRQLNVLTEEEFTLIAKPDGLGPLIRALAARFPASSLIEGTSQVKAWEIIGVIYQNLGRNSEALAAFSKLYDQMLVGQNEMRHRFHKGMPLVRMSDCFLSMGYPLLALRYVMLTLVEDAAEGQGAVSPEKTGVYWRLVWRGWLSEDTLHNYAMQMYKIHNIDPGLSCFPEWVLQQVDNNWITFAPTPQEAGVFVVNSHYLKVLVSRLGDGTGKTLEQLAEYLVSCMPGCRTARRLQSNSTDYDVVCSVEGLENDFRSELGRYFVCECKDWNRSADFTSFAKFCRVLDSIKARFGIMFSCRGISGTGRREDVDLEQIKVFQDRGMVIIVITENDINEIVNGANLISLLRNKYETVRLNLTGRT